MRVADGAWCWFNEPRALTTQGVTIVGWVGRNGDIRVGSYDNASGALETHVLHPTLQYDDHANPAFYVRQDGRITAFYSRHAGRPLYYRTTTAPGDVSSWGPEQTIPTNSHGPYGYTYPNPIWSPLESKLYLFWRGGNFLPNFSTSEDEGETWAPVRTLLDDNEPESSQRPYAKYVEHEGVIHMAYTQSHPRNRPTSLFYLKYTPGAGWQRAGGADLGEPPFIPTDGDRVYDAFQFDMRSWLHDIAVHSDGNPRLVFATFSRTAHWTDHRYWYARWDGHQWHKREFTRAGPSIDPDGEVMYTAGAVLDQARPEIVYLARRKGEFFQVERWRTPDGGQSWDTTPITTSANNHMRPVVPRDHGEQGPMPVFYMVGRYDSFTTFKTDIALVTEPQP